MAGAFPMRALYTFSAALVGASIAACHDPVAEPRGAAAPGEPPVTSLPPPFTPDRVMLEEMAMGTHVALTAYTTPRVDARAAREAFESALAEIRRLERLMTTWRPDSDVSKVNAAAGKEPVVVSNETLEVVQQSLRAAEMSEGTFDITFETLHGLWKFDEDLDPHPPSEADVKARLAGVGWRHVQVDAAKHTVFIDREGTRIGLGGIAKGYAVDRAASILTAKGLPAFYVQAGGDLYARGTKPDGTPWVAGIRDPRGKPDQFFALLPLVDHAFSTAGDYERGYVVGGKRYHHIIDPRTGMPATASRSVTVWAPSAFIADAIDDAIFILGPEKGSKLCESVDGCGAVIVDAKNNLWVTKRLEGHLKVTAVPTDGI